MSHRYLHNIRQTVECLTSSVFRKTLTTKRAYFLHVCPSYLCTICEFQPLMTHLCQYGTTCACFLQMATKKLLITAFVSDRKIVFFFVFFFLCDYVFVYLFFFWTQLLRPLHAETPNMAPRLYTRLGAKKANFQRKAPVEYHLRWLPVGIIFKHPPSIYFYLFFFLHRFARCGVYVCWHDHSGKLVTALIVLHLLLNSHLYIQYGTGKLNWNLNSVMAVSWA